MTGTSDLQNAALGFPALMGFASLSYRLQADFPLS